MTRVEKYRRYRNQISNMKVEKITAKKEAADHVKEINNTKLDYEQVMGVHNVFDDSIVETKHKRGLKITKFQLIYWLIAFFIIAIILLATIFEGIKLWR